MIYVYLLLTLFGAANLSNSNIMLNPQNNKWSGIMLLIGTIILIIIMIILTAKASSNM